MTIRLHTNECSFKDMERALLRKDAVRIDNIDVPARLSGFALNLIRVGYLAAKKDTRGTAPAGRPPALTEDQCIEIRQAYRQGETQGQLAQRFGVSRPTINKAVNAR